MSKKFTALMILDGFGERAEAAGNAVLAAKINLINSREAESEMDKKEIDRFFVE